MNLSNIHVRLNQLIAEVKTTLKGLEQLSDEIDKKLLEEENENG